MNAIAVKKELNWRYNAVNHLQQQITLLTLKAIAERVRAVLPDAAMVGLPVTDQPYGTYRVPGRYYTAEELPITESDWPGWKDELDDAIYDLCTGLDDANAGTWQPFTRIAGTRDGDPADSDLCLILDDALAIELDGAATGADPLRFYDADLWFIAADEDTPRSDQYRIEVFGLSIIIRRRPGSTYVHLDTQHAAEAPLMPLDVEVDNGGKTRHAAARHAPAPAVAIVEAVCAEHSRQESITCDEVDRLEPPVATATIRDGWLVCPHCGGRDSIVEIDSATRKHRLSVVSDDVVGHMAHGDFQTIGFQCTDCDHEVDVPFEVYHD